MEAALAEARLAESLGEVPVGAVIVDPSDGRLVAVGRNRVIDTSDPTAHAEIEAIRAAARKRGNYRLNGLELFVTLEPCAMCATAMAHARIARLVYGADDPKGGGVVHGPRIFEQPTTHHRPIVEGGVLAEPSRVLLQGFFRARRVQAG